MSKDWREQAKANVADKSQGDRFKLVEGPNIFRILPNAKAIKHDNYEKYPPYDEYLVHKNVGPNKKIVICGKDIVTKEEECWLCDEIIERYNKSSKASKRAVAKQIEPSPQMIMQVARWDRNTESLRGPLKFYVPGSGGANSVSVKLEGLLANSRRHYDHPSKGYNINIPRTGTGPKDTRYGAPEPDESRSKVSSGILRKVIPFEELVDEYDEEFQRAMFYGESVEEASKRRKFAKEEDNHMAMKKKKVDKEVKGKKKGKEEEASSSESESGSGSGSESSSESEKKAAKKKRGPGRPPGSKSKKKGKEEEESSSESESGSGSSSESESGSGSESSSESSSESESEPKNKKKKKK
jgi:hypothetical protein